MRVCSRFSVGTAGQNRLSFFIKKMDEQHFANSINNLKFNFVEEEGIYRELGRKPQLMEKRREVY